MQNVHKDASEELDPLTCDSIAADEVALQETGDERCEDKEEASVDTDNAANEVALQDPRDGRD